MGGDLKLTIMTRLAVITTLYFVLIGMLASYLVGPRPRKAFTDCSFMSGSNRASIRQILLYSPKHGKLSVWACVVASSPVGILKVCSGLLFGASPSRPSIECVIVRWYAADCLLRAHISLGVLPIYVPSACRCFVSFCFSCIDGSWAIYCSPCGPSRCNLNPHLTKWLNQMLQLELYSINCHVF